MQLGHLAHQREPEPGPRVLARQAAVDLLERLEQVEQAEQLQELVVLLVLPPFLKHLAFNIIQTLMY